jgi:ATP:ADP antiporter, AAA family
MPDKQRMGYTLFERVLRLFTVVRAGEGRCVALFAFHGFLVMGSYYLIKALRESLLLGHSDAEVRSYAVAANGLVLMLLLPLYSAVRRRLDGPRLITAISWLFTINLLLFLLAYPFHEGKWFGIVFFIWSGLFGLLFVAQFWALAAGSFNTKSGQRLFPAIMLGANVGALAGAQTTGQLIGSVGPVGLFALGAVALALTSALVTPELRAIPAASRSQPRPGQASTTNSVFGGFRVVLSDRYLLLVAAFIVLLNCIGSTGDFLLADLIRQRTDALLAVAPAGVTRETIIGTLYAQFQFWVTLVGVLLQMFVVSRVFRNAGIRGALLVLPVISLAVYSTIGFVPIFSIIFVAKVIENSTNYSLMNTTQQALYLPTSPLAKYDGKTTIDTFFWRFGDVLQAGLVYVGLNAFDLAPGAFALVNVGLCAIWIALAVAIGARFSGLTLQESGNAPPTLARAIPDAVWRPGEKVRFALPTDTFFDPDAGDVLSFRAQLEAGGKLPGWLLFDPDLAEFRGTPPPDAPPQLRIKVVATDSDGATATASFALARSTG